MLILVGYLVVIGAVFGGFSLAGGHLAALFQPLELLMIGGAAIGAFITSNSGKVIKHTLHELGGLFKSSIYTKAFYNSLLSLMFSLLTKMRSQGALAVEADIENPKESPIFTQYPKLLANHELMDFITDYFRIIISASLNPHQIENLMDAEIETHHHQAAESSHVVTKIADGMPAFGIVAAVMGVVHTMESISLPPSELGILIAHALVGTFLGILLGYGFIGPLAVLLEARAAESTMMFHCVKMVLLAQMHGYPPQFAVEFGRKVLFSTERPGAKELEQMLSDLKKAANAAPAAA